jgi:hypothetical protein
MRLRSGPTCSSAVHGPDRGLTASGLFAWAEWPRDLPSRFSSIPPCVQARAARAARGTSVCVASVSCSPNRAMHGRGGPCVLQTEHLLRQKRHRGRRPRGGRDASNVGDDHCDPRTRHRAGYGRVADRQSTVRMSFRVLTAAGKSLSYTMPR